MCVHAANMIICFGGPDYTIIAGGKRFYFERHSYLGPILLTKKGDPAARQPGERSPFWTAFTQWEKQGKVVDDAGFCCWRPEPEPIVEVDGHGRRFIVGYRDVPGGWPLEGGGEGR